MSTDNKTNNLNCFSQVSTKYCEQKRGIRRSFHENIKKRKDYVVNFFESQPYYKELMPTIKKNNRGNAFYKNIIRKGRAGKSKFFLCIMDAINKAAKKSLEKFQEKVQRKKLYRVSQLDLLKRQKEKMELSLKKRIKKEKEKENNDYKKTIIKNKSMMDILSAKREQRQQSQESMIKSSINNITINGLNNTNNNFNNSISNDTFHTNNNESMINIKDNASVNNLKVKIPKLNINNNKSRNNINLKNKDLKNYLHKKYEKKLKMEKLINKCNEEISFAQNMEDNVGKNNNNKSMDDIGKKIKNVLKNGDQKVIEDKGLENKKYKKLEKEKYDELKRMVDIKVSNNYAYINRKELQDAIRDNETILAYQIYLRDMHKINRKLVQNKKTEKKNMNLVENLLEDVFRHKEFVKHKVDNYYIRNAKMDELNMFSLQNKDELYENNNNKELTKGNLLPKLIEIKDFCYGRKKYNPVADLENNE